MRTFAEGKRKFREELKGRTAQLQSLYFDERFEEIWAKHMQPEVDRMLIEQK